MCGACSADKGRFLRRACPTCPPSVEDPYEAHLDSAWQFQRHAWQQRASAEWSSAPIRAPSGSAHALSFA